MFKEENDNVAHRLRVLHLCEADLDLLVGTKWKSAVCDAMKTGTLHPGQFGSVPGVSATASSLNEELIGDCANLTRTNLCTVHSDLASCCDGIISPVSSLIARSHGIHRNVVHVHATNIEESKYKLKLGNKITDSFYQHQDNWGIYGSGQGSASSPAIWAFISSKLFQSHDSKAHGLPIQMPMAAAMATQQQQVLLMTR